MGILQATTIDSRSFRLRYTLNAAILLLRGPVGYLAAGLLLVSYMTVALEPFDWTPPPRIENGAKMGNAGIRISAPGIVLTRNSSRWLEDAIDCHQLHVCIRARTFSPLQFGPARIFTISADPDSRNLTIAQQGVDLVIRLRTPATTRNGAPEIVIPKVFHTATWRTIALSVQSRLLTVSIDGQRRVALPLPDRPLRDWSTGFRAAVGNELTGDRPWRGEVSHLTVSVGEQEVDFLNPALLKVPSHFWVGLKTRWFYPLDDAHGAGAWCDVVLNFVCFIPFGFVVAMLRGIKRPLSFATYLCATASFSVEVLQIGFAERYPSLVDWGTNTLGAMVGAFIACRLVASQTQSDEAPDLA